jgi:catechol-2,3-dioxygenase
MAPTSAPPDGPNLRPTLWVGHIALGVPDTQASKRFFIELGLRDVEPIARLASSSFEAART